MKKLIALLVVVMMMALPFATAETVFTFANPVLTLNMGETQTIDLTGMELAATGGMVGESLVFQLDINGDGSKLLGVIVNLVGDRVVFSAEGMSSAYYVQLPEQAKDLTTLQLPEIDIDFEALTEILMNGIEMDGDTIHVPYTTLNALLEQLIPTIESIEVPGVDMGEITGVISQLKEADAGFDLTAKYNEDEAGMSLSVEVSLVQGGEVAQAGIVTADIAIGETINVDFDVANQASFHFDMQGQTITLAVNADGAGVELKGDVGVTEADVPLVELDAANAINVEEITDEQSQAMMGELMSVAGGLLPYISNVLGAAA